MCKFSSKSEGVPFQPLGDLTWNDPCNYSNACLTLYCNIDKILREPQMARVNSICASTTRAMALAK